MLSAYGIGFARRRARHFSILPLATDGRRIAAEPLRYTPIDSRHFGPAKPSQTRSSYFASVLSVSLRTDSRATVVRRDLFDTTSDLIRDLLFVRFDGASGSAL